MRIAPPWNDARTWLEERWGAPVARVGVDGGFSCPNRGWDQGGGGCSFCSETGNRPPYQEDGQDIVWQIRSAKNFLKTRYGSKLFSLYFQSYSSTWAPTSTLRSVYDLALAEGPFVDLTVGTRPDCVPDSVADLLAGYQTAERDVWVELGLQSANDSTLKRIGRGHGVQAYVEASERLRIRGLPFTTHVMFGLPGEGPGDFQETVNLAVASGSSGLKFHDLILLPGTRLHKDWEHGLIEPVNPELYLDAVASALLSLPNSIVVWRVCSDPEDRQGPRPPGEKWPKNRFLNRLSAEILRRRSQLESGTTALP